MENVKEEGTVKQRLKDFVASLGITESEFCRRLGVGGAYISSIKKSVSPKVMNTLQEQYPDLNPNWLLAGKGKMLLSEEMEEQKRKTLLPSEMLTELLKKSYEEKAAILELAQSQKAIIEKLQEEYKNLQSLAISQQDTIVELTRELKKATAQQGGAAACVDAV